MTPIHLSDARVKEFRASGYVNAGPAFTPGDLEALRAELDRVIAAHDRGARTLQFIESTAAFCIHKPSFFQVGNLRELSPLYESVAFSTNLVSAAARLLAAASLRIFGDQILYKTAEDRELNEWHQDGPAFDILDTDEIITAWMALDDVDETNGCMCMIPGSHRWPAEFHQELRHLRKPGRLDWIPARHRDLPIAVELRPVRAGEIHFHHGLTWHGSVPNASGRPRRSFVIQFIPGDARYRSSGHHFFKPLVQVPDGAVLCGTHFPAVWENGQPVPHPAG